jgi:hypothetical protein
MALADILGLAAQQPQGQNTFIQGLYSPSLQTIPRSQDQLNFLKEANRQSNSIGAMPFVLDPKNLTQDASANKAMMYPASLQPGGVSQVPAGGMNLGPQLSKQNPGTDFGGATDIDSIASIIAQKTGASLQDVKTALMGMLPSVSSNGMYSQAASGPQAPGALSPQGSQFDPTQGRYQMGSSDT